MNADLLSLSIEPHVGMALQSGFAVSAKVELVQNPLKLCVDAFLDLFWLKMCTKFRAKFPGGFKWKRKADWNLACFTMGGRRQTLSTIGGDDSGVSPPPPGRVAIVTRAGMADV